MLLISKKIKFSFLVQFIIILILVKEFKTNFNVKRKKLVELGDLMIGALIPVHEQPSYNDNESTSGSKRKCGVIRDQYGVQRVEALLYMLDKINTKSQLLPGIKLGLDLRDECWETSIALEETIDFIKDTIASDNNNYNNNNNIENNYENSSFVNKKNNNNYSNDLYEYDYIHRNTLITQEKCQSTKDKTNSIFAVIGPAGSSVAINVQNLLQLFDIPQIGYSATSRDLSDKKMFKTFLRVVPSDYLQVKAMTDVVVKMNWTYLFAIYTDGSYGQAGMEAFRNETSYLNICLAMYEKIREYASDDDYELVIRRMNKTSNAKVIVCFCYGETIRGLLGAINRLGLKGRFIIFGSDGWSDRIDVAKDYYEEAIGSFSLKAYSPVVTEFDDYFINLNPTNNVRNIWFTEYWEERFKCYIDDSTMAKYKTPCKITWKCPTNFIKIDKHCYWFSDINLSWSDAQKECKKKSADAKIIDLNNEKDLENVLDYLLKNKMDQHLNKMHVRIDLTENLIYQESDDGKHFYDEYATANNEQNIKFKYCKSSNSNEKNKKKRKKNDYTLYDQVAPFNDSIKDFESSLGGEDVITFFISKVNHNFQCSSIVITKNYSNNLSYCIELKKCNNKLPFICKIPFNENQNKSKISDDLYRDSLVNYQQDPKMSYVMNSLLAVVHGLSRIHQNICRGQYGLCDRMKKINGSELLKNIKESSFLGITGEKINFDPNGDPPGRYVVLNVQKELNIADNSIKYVYKEIGNWNNENRLNLDFKLIKFPNEKKSFRSVCSEQCQFGHVKQIKQGGLKCCWNCKKCDDYSYILDEHTCQECDLGFWPNKNLTGCEKLPLTYLKWNEPAPIITLIISCIGILLNTFVTNIFIKFSNTCVVKSTTKELSFIILIGVYLCYFITIPLILKPTYISCLLSRIMPGFSLSVIYGALLTKTNRIARILARSKKIMTKKPRFMSLTSQILITCLIIGTECCLIITEFILEPQMTMINYSKRNEARLECYNTTLSVLVPLGYNMFLIALCTLYAIKTRNLPENFNEAKFIGFSMYTTCVIWSAFVPLYFGSDFKVVTLSLSTSFSATVILAFLFVPKVYIILFKPEKNQRSAFATSKNIRCHFGSNEKSSFNKSSHGLVLLTGLAGIGGIKPNQVLISKSENNLNSTKITSNYIRYAYRPKFRYIQSNEQSLDLNQNYTSIYQIGDRSCQTSLDLIKPYIDTEFKKRKLNTDFETRSLKDTNEIRSEDTAEKCNSVNNLAIEALGNLLFFPLIASASSKTSSQTPIDIQTNESELNNNDSNDNDKTFRSKNEKMNYLSVNGTVSTEQDKMNRANTRKESNTSLKKFNNKNPKKLEYETSSKDSLEEFKNAFSKNQNLIVNLDNVKSSDYL